MGRSRRHWRASCSLTVTPDMETVTSTLGSFLSNFLAVARIVLMAATVTSSPESAVTWQQPRYFTCEQLLQESELFYISNMAVTMMKTFCWL